MQFVSYPCSQAHFLFCAQKERPGNEAICLSPVGCMCNVVRCYTVTSWTGLVD